MKNAISNCGFVYNFNRIIMHLINILIAFSELGSTFNLQYFNM